MPSAYLGIGGNLGDRLGFLADAVRRLHSVPNIRVIAASSVYESKAMGPAQPDFLNAALHVATTCAPHELLAECLRIEIALGRVRRERWGPRTIDIDLLVYDAVTVADETLTVPHPGMMERAFVLIPLAEIAPELSVGGEPVRLLAARVDGSGLRKLGPLRWNEEEETSPDARLPS